LEIDIELDYRVELAVSSIYVPADAPYVGKPPTIRDIYSRINATSSANTNQYQNETGIPNMNKTNVAVAMARIVELARHSPYITIPASKLRRRS
jgi:hypothetical protein